MKITKIYFSPNFIFGCDDKGNKYSQSLDWYPALRNASDEQRANYIIGFTGIHWEELNEDISFESFEQSKDLQEFVIERQSRLNEIYEEQNTLIKLTEELRKNREWGQLELYNDRLQFLIEESSKILEELENELLNNDE